MTDTISDMLTRIRNASQALQPEVEVTYSKLKENLARVLKKEGYIADYGVEGATIKQIRLKLKFLGRKGVIAGLRRVSRPGLRRYVGSQQVPRVLGGLGVAILSTPQGVMTGAEARRQNVGGELLCYVW
ncbi:MAG: 30S ribosomal protein S8 [Verrucomicrobia bacterium]|nr:30S ribosomal protein S8 [Verrucomicrobiota bacterium]